jgi:hypothetical protein
MAPLQLTLVVTMESTTTGHCAFELLFARNINDVVTANEDSARKARFISICYMEYLGFPKVGSCTNQEVKIQFFRLWNKC